MRMGGNIVGPHGARVHDQPAVVSGHRPQSELRPREDRVSGRSERSQAEPHRVGGKLIRLRSDADRIKNLAFASYNFSISCSLAFGNIVQSQYHVL